MKLVDYFTENEKLRAEWAAELNTKQPTELTNYSREKVWWRCESGHEWLATPEARTALGRGCPYCRNQKVIPGETDLVSRQPQKAALWHPELNGNLKPEEVSPNSHRKAWWRCAEGHVWQAQIYSVTHTENGCPNCSGLKPVPGATDLQTKNPEVAVLWDYSKNNGLTPRDVSSGSKVRVWWKCEKGHSWLAQVYSIALGGTRCPYCMGFKAISGETDLVTTSPEVAAQWDYEKNGELDPRTVSPASHDKAWWKCELGHSWKSAPYSRTKENGSGCPYCTGRKVLPGFNDLGTLKPGLAEEWYQPLNGELKPSDVTLGSNKKVWWRCGERHVWQAAIYARTKPNGTGCPVCAGVAKARKIRYFVDQPKLQFLKNPKNDPAGGDLTRRRFG